MADEIKPDGLDAVKKLCEKVDEPEQPYISRKYKSMLWGFFLTFVAGFVNLAIDKVEPTIMFIATLAAVVVLASVYMLVNVWQKKIEKSS